MPAMQQTLNQAGESAGRKKTRMVVSTPIASAASATKSRNGERIRVIDAANSSFSGPNPGA